MILSDVDCRYCSAVSKAVGEDPIGSAIAADQWLFIEVPRPWTKALWADQPHLAPLLPIFEQIRRKPHLWQRLRIGAIAPDAEYSRPGHSHVLYYHRPSQPFSQFEAHTYCLPTEQVAHLAQALLLQPKQLTTFANCRQPTTTRDLLICTHTHYDVACGRFGTPFYKKLRKDHGSPSTLHPPAHPSTHPPPPSLPLRIWQTSHFGGHNFAPTLIDFPTGHFWGHLDEDGIDPLIRRQGEVTSLRPFYRGWAGCDRWAQIAEREIWMQEGWPWLRYQKSAQMIAKDPGKFSHRLLRWVLRWVPTIRAQVLLKKLEQKLNWAQVRIQYRHPDSGEMGTYEVRVEVSHTVMSQMKSGQAQASYPVKQYRVVKLQKL
ncbi:MAG: sucrase ferredoxin [Synechococcales bacterium]|nr:sucrase ferredoxin [Synechococcales bacterium]